jgi:N-acetylglutamate synthase-like GNAT family acetyltransferase
MPPTDPSADDRAVIRHLRVRDPQGLDIDASFREARPSDVLAIAQLVEQSARALSRDDYSREQLDSAIGTALGVDSQLIRDRTYFVAEAVGRLIACGGWSWRKTLFGGDAKAGREPDALDPTRDAARIRAFFVHPDFARQGLGRSLLELCEGQIRAHGFTAVELMATLPGQRLYRAYGFEAMAPMDYPLQSGVVIRFVPMRKQLSAANRGNDHER